MGESGSNGFSIESLKEHRWGFAIGLLGLIIVMGYLAFEFLLYGEFLEDISHRPLEHLVIFSLMPLSVILGYLVDKDIKKGNLLNESRREAELILENIGEGVIELGPDFRIKSVNNYVTDLMGKKKNDLLGKKCYQVFHGYKDVCFECPVIESFDTGTPSYSFHEGSGPDGSKISMELYTYPLKNADGVTNRVIEVLRNVTERKKHEMEMREKEYLEKMNRLAVDREMKMVELKKEIITLRARIKELEGDTGKPG